MVRGEQGPSSRVSPGRILSGVAMVLVAFSAFAQCAMIVMTITGAADAISSFAGVAYLIAIGILLTFLRCVRSLIRYCAGKEDWRILAVWLMLSLCPFALYGVAYQRALSAPGKPTTEQPESELFLAGYDWGKTHEPKRPGLCEGVADFARGCRAYLADRSKAQLEAGQKWAAENRPERASACQGALHFVLGCRRQHNARITEAGIGGFQRYAGMSTEECKYEVNTQYEATTALFLYEGNPHGVEVVRRRRWEPDLQACETLDQRAELNVFGPANIRLSSALEQMKSGKPVNEATLEALRKDREWAKALPGYRKSYLEMSDEFFARQRGEYKEVVRAFPQISCQEYVERIAAMVKLDDERTSAMQALRAPGGVVTDSARYNQLNKERIDMMWDWKLYSDGAKAAGCASDNAAIPHSTD